MLSKPICVWLVSLCLSIATFAWADMSTDQSNRSLTKGANPLWYNEDEQSLNFPPAQSLQEAEVALFDRHRTIEAEIVPGPTPTGNPAWWESIVEALANIVPWLLWGLLAFFLIGLAIHLWLAVERGADGRRRRIKTHTGDAVGHENAKLVDLPFSIDAPAGSFFEQAQASRRDGDFGKSIVYLFSHILVEMDKANCIRLQRGKTNLSYLRELRNEPKLAQLYQHSVRVFEAIFFGRYAVNQEQCERFWSLLPTIEQSIREAVHRRTTESEAVASTSHSSSKSLAVDGPTTIALLVLASVVGCSSKTELPLDNYGASNAYSRKSVSGLTVFRELCEQRTLQTSELLSLSERSRRLDAIVWVPKDFRIPNEQEVEWFDQWLTHDPGRKLIWVGRDYSPASHYWGKAADSSAPEDRRTYRLEQALADTEFELARIQSESEQECEWFEQRLEEYTARRVDRFQGPWADRFDVDQSEIYLRGELVPMKAPPTSATSNSQKDHDIVRVETLLASSDGSPVISSISRPRWGSGRMILVANGSVLANEALTNRGNLEVAKQLIDQCTPDGRIGFLSNIGPTRIRQPSDEEEPKGFEWLRVWPMSLIAIQGLFVGAIALLAMLPIFGRPQRLPAPSTTDFGKHIEALGDLLAKTRDRNFALQRIADYFREVRGDLASPWSNKIEETTETTQTSVPVEQIKP